MTDYSLSAESSFRNDMLAFLPPVMRPLVSTIVDQRIAFETGHVAVAETEGRIPKSKSPHRIVIEKNCLRQQEQFLSLKEASEIYNISVKNLRKLCHDKILKAGKIGINWIVSEQSLRNYLDAKF
jgi:hypothetical protein